MRIVQNNPWKAAGRCLALSKHSVSVSCFWGGDWCLHWFGQQSHHTQRLWRGNCGSPWSSGAPHGTFDEADKLVWRAQDLDSSTPTLSPASVPYVFYGFKTVNLFEPPFYHLRNGIMTYTFKGKQQQQQQQQPSASTLYWKVCYRGKMLYICCHDSYYNQRSNINIAFLMCHGLGLRKSPPLLGQSNCGPWQCHEYWHGQS